MNIIVCVMSYIRFNRTIISKWKCIKEPLIEKPPTLCSVFKK